MKKKTMIFNCETLTFDRTCECDWCGKSKLVGITHYGTTNYNRLICEDCAKKIIQYHKSTFNEDIDVLSDN